MNPQTLMRIMSLKNQFQNDHPKFFAFLVDFFRKGVTADTIIEITVTRPDGTTTATNMKVKQSDLDLFNELKNMGMNQ